jgi:hypothetical protein
VLQRAIDIGFQRDVDAAPDRAVLRDDRDSPGILDAVTQ